MVGAGEAESSAIQTDVRVGVGEHANLATAPRASAATTYVQQVPAHEPAVAAVLDNEGAAEDAHTEFAKVELLKSQHAAQSPVESP